jgi:hypothetical protein
MNDKTLIEWNADVGTRFLTIHPDGSFEINENTPPLYALGELAKAFMRQQDRIKRLEEAGDAVEERLGCGCGCGGPCRACQSESENWFKAKEAKL